MQVRRRYIDRQENTVFLDGHLYLDVSDFLPAVDTALVAALRGAAGSAIDNHGTRFGSIAAGMPPGTAEPVEQPASSIIEIPGMTVAVCPVKQS